jgi:hypothetical protein
MAHNSNLLRSDFETNIPMQHDAHAGLVGLWHDGQHLQSHKKLSHSKAGQVLLAVHVGGRPGASLPYTSNGMFVTVRSGLAKTGANAANHAACKHVSNATKLMDCSVAPDHCCPSRVPHALQSGHT